MWRWRGWLTSASRLPTQLPESLILSLYTIYAGMIQRTARHRSPIDRCPRHFPSFPHGDNDVVRVSLVRGRFAPSLPRQRRSPSVSHGHAGSRARNVPILRKDDSRPFHAVRLPAFPVMPFQIKLPAGRVAVRTATAAGSPIPLPKAHHGNLVTPPSAVQPTDFPFRCSPSAHARPPASRKQHGNVW